MSSSSFNASPNHVFVAEIVIWHVTFKVNGCPFILEDIIMGNEDTTMDIAIDIILSYNETMFVAKTDIEVVTLHP